MLDLTSGGRVSNVSPSLSPRKRYERELIEKTRQLDREHIAEKIERDAITVAKDGEVDTTNSLAQLGNPLSTQQVIERLKKCNPDLIFEVSKADKTKYGVYTMGFQDDEYRKMFLVGMENGIQPEFSVRHYREEKVAKAPPEVGWQMVKTFTRETRGWRTVLARLIKAGYVREADVLKYFPLGRDSKNWSEQLGHRSY